MFSSSSSFFCVCKYRNIFVIQRAMQFSIFYLSADFLEERSWIFLENCVVVDVALIPQNAPKSTWFMILWRSFSSEAVLHEKLIERAIEGCFCFHLHQVFFSYYIFCNFSLKSKYFSWYRMSQFSHLLRQN